MGKALKFLYGPVLGVIVDGKKGLVRGAMNAVGFLIGGPTFVAAQILSAGASLLSGKPKSPAGLSSTSDRLTVSINTREPRKIVFGTTAMATDLRDQEYSDNQTYLHRFIVVASHRVTAIRAIYFDDKLAWTAAGGAQGEFQKWLQVTPVLEGNAANAINLGPRMGRTRRFTGCAYVYLRYQILDTSKKKVDSVFNQSIPSRVTIVGDGASVYDPRRDSTVPGGSGPQRADDQSTWAWDDSASRNPALCTLFYLLGWRIAGRLAVGKGIPPERLDLASFIEAANLCDEPVIRSAGGTEPRYRCDGVISEGDATDAVLDNLKASMNAVLDDIDGRLRLTVLHNDLAAPIGSLVTDDVLGAFTWSQTLPLNDSVNVIRGGYVDPSTTSLFQLADYPEVSIASRDGIERSQTLNYPLVQSASQAQRLSKQRLQRMIYGGTFTATFQATAWKFQKGDVIRLTFRQLGWDRKLFRIADMAIQVDGKVPMMLREEHSAIYAWDGSDAAPVTGAEPTRYDASLWPLIQGLTDAGKSAEWPSIGDPDNTKPQDNATVGAPPGTNVGDREAQELVASVDINTKSILEEALRQDDLQRIFDARTFVQGQPVGPIFIEFKEAQDLINAKVATDLSLIGYRTTNGTGWVLNLDTVRFGNDGTSLARSLEEVAVATVNSNATITTLNEALIGPQGGGYAKSIVRADADGVFAAFSLTADGPERLGKMAFFANEFEFVDPSGGNPLRVLSYNGAEQRWEFHTDVYAKRLVADSIETKNLQQFAVKRPYYTQTAQNVALPYSNGSVIIAQLVTNKDLAESDLEVAWMMRMRPGGGYAGYFQLERNGIVVDQTWYWMTTANISNINSVRSVMPNRLRIYDVPKGTHTWTLRFVYFGHDGGTGTGFIEAGSNLSVDEAKRA
ncbi:phage tail protein [Sphingomonas sp. BK235]|uniref:phage tail protein n=1 Tax=Sphingomonas sp. BK235 TaxID=2512131 RepID=UPI00104B11AA|nr:phage tail protein [Sphingomonas sp. BK235]TCP33280.1 putative tail protein [Sphingomonas sp. BK235]